MLFEDEWDLKLNKVMSKKVKITYLKMTWRWLYNYKYEGNGLKILQFILQVYNIVHWYIHSGV